MSLPACSSLLKLDALKIFSILLLCCARCSAVIQRSPTQQESAAVQEWKVLLELAEQGAGVRQVVAPAMQLGAGMIPAPQQLLPRGLLLSAGRDQVNALAAEAEALRQENTVMLQEQAAEVTQEARLRLESEILRKESEELQLREANLRLNYTQLWQEHQEALYELSRERQKAVLLQTTPVHEVLIKRTDEENDSKSKLILVIIEVVGLGICGVDRCYLGQYFAGIVKGLTLGGFFGWAMIDYMIVLVNSLEKADTIDVLGLNATFVNGTAASDEELKEFDTCFWIMLISYVCIFVGEVFSCLHMKMKPLGPMPRQMPNMPQTAAQRQPLNV